MGVTITSSNKFPRKAWAGLALGSALLFGASWLWLNQDFPLPGQAKSGVIVPALEVEAGTVEVILSESGSVELGSQKVLLAPREATVDEVLVQVNDRVKLNQPLIRLRFTTNQTSLEEEELKVHQKELSIEQERQAIEQQQLALTEAEANSATGDIAEIYFQYALIYQAIGEHDKAKEYKEKALELFEQMEAPKQIERVNQAFGGNIQ